MVKLSNRIAALKMAEDEDDNAVPKDAGAAAQEATMEKKTVSGASRLSKAARSAIFREVVLAKVRELKEIEEREKKIAEHNA
jgi:calcium/calmodulin-dependent protein kinase I